MDWRSEIRRAFGRAKYVDEGVVEELAQHAAAAYETARADGLSPDEAAANVRALLASWCAATDGPKHARRIPLIESAPASRSAFAGLSLDVRHAFRVLRRHRGFAFVSILMIALGVAASSAIFSVMNGVLLKPLPWKEPDRLVRLAESREGGSTTRVPNMFTNAAFHTWLRSSPSTIEGIGAWHPEIASVDSETGAQQLIGSGVSAGLFPLLGASPAIGRGFTEADAHDDKTVILSYGLWQERFGGSNDVLGQSLILDGKPKQIIGVMPRDFTFPSRDQRFWVPFEIIETKQPGTTGTSLSLFSAIARVKPGVTPQAVSAEAQARVRASDDLGLVGAAVFGSNGPAVIVASPMLDAMTHDVRPAIFVMFAAVLLLFLAAVGNVANMQLAHATARRREVAIRAAIGAGSRRLARQLLVETSLVAVAGGLLGLLMTAGLLRLLATLLPTDFPRPQEIAIDARVGLLVAGLTVAASLLIGLLPSRLARRINLNSALVEDAAPVGQGWRSPSTRSRALLVTAQVAIATLLLVGATLLGRSFTALLNADRGYVPANIMTARVKLPEQVTAAARREFFSTLASRLAAVNGVTHVAYTGELPLTGTDTLVGFNMPNPKGGQTVVNGLQRTVSRDYFQTMGMRIREGRGFTSADSESSEPVMLVNQAFARAFLGEHPLNMALPAGLNNDKPDMNPWRVIGIVDDVHHRSATEPTQPEIYVLDEQTYTGGQEYVVARTTGDAATLVGDIRAIARDLDRRALLDQELTMNARLMASLSKPRLYAVLLSGFAVFAVLIAAIGLFGGLSYNVTQRRREIGVRTARGATAGNIVRLVVGQGVVMITAGLVVGMALAAVSARYLSTFLFGIAPRDPLTFVGSGLVLLAIGLLACALPAMRAARIDATTALKR